MTLFTGRELDETNRLFQYRVRHYHAQTGRFVGRDPFGVSSSSPLSASRGVLASLRRCPQTQTDSSLYGYSRSNPNSLVDPLGLEACECPECEWSFQGRILSGSAGFGYSYGRVTARCLKAKLTSQKRYICESHTFFKDTHCFCEAKLSLYTPSGGLQAGISLMQVFGHFNACTSDDIGGALGYSLNVTFISVGAESGADFWGGGGFAPGVSVGANINRTFIRVRSAELRCVEESLTTHQRRYLETQDCTICEESFDPPEIVDNPHAIRLPETKD